LPLLYEGDVLLVSYVIQFLITYAEKNKPKDEKKRTIVSEIIIFFNIEFPGMDLID